MPKPIQDMTSWGASNKMALDTTPPTTTSAALGRSNLSSGDSSWPSGPTDVGRRVGDTQWDMSVVCDAAEALSLQFDVLQPLFMAVHDIGGTTSRRLLAGVAAAMQIPVHTLTIRRQGFGNMLARLEFVELRMHDAATRISRHVRIYSTVSPEADATSRRQLVDVLLGRAGLAVAIIGADATQAALAMALGGLQEAMGRASWSNRHLLLMPLAAIPTLKGQISRLGHGREVEVTLSPMVVRPFDAWNHIRSTWNSLADRGESSMLPLDDPTSPGGRATGTARPSAEATAAAMESLRRKLMAGQSPASGVHVPDPTPGSEAHVDAVAKNIASLPRRDPPRGLVKAPPPLHGHHASPVARPASDDAHTIPANLSATVEEPIRPAATPGDLSARLHSLLVQCANLGGMQSCAIIDLATRSVVAQYLIADPRAFAGHGTRLANALRAAALGFDLPGRVPDAAMTYDEHHVLVRPVPGEDHLAMVAILDREEANVVVIRLKLQRLEKSLFPEVAARTAAIAAAQ